MNKNDQQNCGGEEQHSNLDLIKKIQAQISILEKNSNQEAQSIIQEIQGKMNLLIKSSSFSAPKLKEEESLSHDEPAKPYSPKKQSFSSLTDSKTLQKDSAFSAFKTTDCSFTSTIVPLGRLIGHPTNNTSAPSIIPIGSTQAGSISGEVAVEASTSQQEIQLKQDSAQIQVESSNDKLENISCADLYSPNPTDIQTQKVKSEKAQYQQIQQSISSPSQLQKKSSNSLNNENILGKRLRENDAQMNFKLDLNQYIQQSIAQSNNQPTANNKDDLIDDKAAPNLDSILNHCLSMNPALPMSFPGGNMYGSNRQAAIAAMIMNQYKINDNNYETLSANQRITQQLIQKLSAENNSFAVPNTNNFKQLITPPDVSQTMSSLSQQIQEMRKREQKLFKNVDVVQAPSEFMTLQQVQKDSEAVAYSNLMQNPSIQESGVGKQISRNETVADQKGERELRTQQIFGFQHQIKQQTSQPFVISKPQNHNEVQKQSSQKIGLIEPAKVQLDQMERDRHDLLRDKLRMVLQQKIILQKSQLSNEDQPGMPESEQQNRVCHQRSRAGTCDTQLRTKIINSKQITEGSKHEEFKIQRSEEDQTSSKDGQNSQMIESEEDEESEDSSVNQPADCTDLSEENEHGSAKSVDNYNKVQSIIQEKRRDAKTKIIKKNLGNIGTIANSKDDKKNLKFDCPICFKKYGKAQALGGHMSKAHPQMSDQYLYKQKRRNERTLERKILQQAKLEYQRIYNSPGIFHRTKLNQIKLRIKDDLKSMNETNPAQLSEKVLTTQIQSSKQKDDAFQQTKSQNIQSNAQPEQVHDERYLNIAAAAVQLISPPQPLFISHKPASVPFTHLADALKLMHQGLFQGEDGFKPLQLSFASTNTSNINQSLSSHASPTGEIAIQDAKNHHVEDVKESANNTGKQNPIKSTSSTNKVMASKPLFSVVSNGTQINGGSSKQ